MYKAAKSSKAPSKTGTSYNHDCVAPGQKLVDRNLAGVNPLKEQFEPTPAEPIRQRARMAGAGKV